MTRAMEAKVAHHVWSVEEIVGLLGSKMLHTCCARFPMLLVAVGSRISGFLPSNNFFSTGRARQCGGFAMEFDQVENQITRIDYLLRGILAFNPSGIVFKQARHYASSRPPPGIGTIVGRRRASSLRLSGPAVAGT